MIFCDLADSGYKNNVLHFPEEMFIDIVTGFLLELVTYRDIYDNEYNKDRAGSQPNPHDIPPVDTIFGSLYGHAKGKCPDNQVNQVLYQVHVLLSSVSFHISIRICRNTRIKI